jgi:SAM-dependent methyltransferase
MDISEPAVAKAAALAERRGVTLDLNVADILTWPWDDVQYDAIVAVFIQFALPEQRAEIFDGFRRALRPGGTLLLHGYRPEHLELDGVGGPPLAECMYTEQLLRDAFADFEVVSVASYVREVAEGTAHLGQSALIDFVARRPES